jgi:type II secretory pathway pseudopilin PulG
MNNLIISVVSIILAGVLTFYLGYTKGTAKGTAEATALFNNTISEYKAQIDTQADTINKLLEVRSSNLSAEVSSLLKDTGEIRAALKKMPQPLVVVKDSECVADKALLDARREIIERINK